jgi:hypothetical protein
MSVSLEDQVKQLNERVAELLAAGKAVTKQLQEHGDHQSSAVYGHFRERCGTCQAIDHFDAVAASQPPA